MEETVDIGAADSVVVTADAEPENQLRVWHDGTRWCTGVEERDEDEDMTELRRAEVTGSPLIPRVIGGYLPGNYHVEQVINDETQTNVVAIRIVGHDVAGWTLEDYVIPRLQSGLYGCRELTDEEERC